MDDGGAARGAGVEDRPVRDDGCGGGFELCVGGELKAVAGKDGIYLTHREGLSHSFKHSSISAPAAGGWPMVAVPIQKPELFQFHLLNMLLAERWVLQEDT